jgi:4-hydroxy-tetrahydrodipicolinate synthase
MNGNSEATNGSPATPRGVITAIATPFHDDGRVDVAALRRHAARLEAAGVDGIFTCGTTGEGALLSAEEKRTITATVLEEVGNRIPVVGAVIQPDTSNALREIDSYRTLGVRWVAVVAPYYIRVDEAELITHFATIADTSPLPVIVYDIPGNTANPLSDAVYDAVLTHPNVIAVKDSSGNFSRFSRRVLAGGRTDAAAWIQGEDTLDAPSLLVGASGVVSGLSNILPEAFVRMYGANRRGDHKTVLIMQSVINRLHAIVRTTGTGVAAIRLALSLDGIGSRFLHSRHLSLSSDWDDAVKTHVAAAREMMETP